MTQEPSDPPSALPPLFTVAIFGAGLTGFAFITIGVASQVANIAFGLWFAEVFVFFGVPYLVMRLSGYEAFRTAGVSRPWLAGALFGLAVGVVNFFALVVPLQILSQALAPKALIEMFDVSGIFKQQTPVELFGVVTGVCLAAPFCEEFFFRGLMQRGAVSTLGTRRALIVTAVVFSAFHLDPVGFLARAELGLVFGILAIRSGSIWPGVFAHLANNSISVAIYFATRSSEVDDELPGWAPVVMVVVGVALLFALARLAAAVPSILTAPFRAEDTMRRVKSIPTLLVGWVLAGLLAFAALVTVDGPGVRLNVADALAPLKEPKKGESEEWRKSWDALYALRKEVRRGSAKLQEYEAARRAAIADRKTKAK